ncbi:MAG: TonB-dependent receptor [Acidobacteria bacterium]|nr:TonB-dependent receptor [Acidobacteriota bacterium]
MRYVRCLMLMLCGCLAIAVGGKIAHGQVPQGQVLGTVTDPSSAVVQKAKVTLENQLTGVSQSVETGDSGIFTFSYLNSGIYRLRVEKEGFDTAIYPDIQVQIADKKRIDVALQVGQMSVSVQVTGAAARVDTDSSSVSTMISRREALDLPLNGRDFSQLATIEPGITNAGAQGASLLTSLGQYVTVGGNSTVGANYSVDGVDNRSHFLAGPAMNPSVDSIQEFRIEEILSPAEFGGGGAQLMVATKSGQNAFHGNAWEYNRVAALNAGNYYTHKRDSLIRNQFGADIGGPIIKNKLFFYFNWEAQRQVQNFQGQGTVFTNKMRTGDFSELLPDFVVNDPETGLPFPGNVIPADRLNSYMVDLMDSLMPRATASGVINNYTANNPTRTNWEQYSPRVDYQATQKDAFFFKASLQPRRGIDPPASTVWLGQTEDFHFSNAGVGWTRTWSPTLISETRLGWHKESLITDTVQPATPPAMKIQGLGSEPIDHYPILFLSDFDSFGQPGNNLGFAFRTYSLDQNVSIVRGKHLFKVGFSGQRNADATTFAYTRSSWPFLWFSDNVYSGLGAADFLLGIPNMGLAYLASAPRSLRSGNYAVFAQDDWKVSSKLTLNLGLRYELPVQTSEPHNIWANFDQTLGKIVVAGDEIQTGLGPQVPFLLSQYGDYIVPASQSSLPKRTLVYGSHKDFGPRVGFAWRPWGGTNTVIRGGYGIYYVRQFGQNGNNQPASLPYAGILLTYNTTPSPTRYADDFFNGPTGEAPAPSAYLRGPHLPSSSMQQLSLEFQQALPWGMVAKASFQDEHSVHLETGWNANQPRIGPGSISSRTPYPDFSSITGVFNEGNARYDAFQALLRKASPHFTFQTSYRRARNIQESFVDIYNRGQFRGPVGYSPDEIKFHVIADLPFGKGMRWLNQGGIANAVVGGWTVAAIATPYLGGQPFSVTWSGDSANINVYTVRANQTCSGRVSNPTKSNWFDTSCFEAPTPGTVGNARTGALFGPSSFYADFSIYKNFVVREDVKLQFRTEMFNVFNHPNLGAPNATANGFAFGEITSISQVPRVIQLALRLSF